MPYFEELKVGDSVRRSFAVTDQVVREFAALTGDNNPVHLSDEYAASTPFGRRIAHGMLAAGFISATLAQDLPGMGTIYLSQNLVFRAPLYLDQSVTVELTVTSLREDKAHVELECLVRDREGRTVLEGTALVKALRDPNPPVA